MVRHRLRLLLLAAGAAVLIVLVRRVGLATITSLLRQVGWGFAVVSVLYFTHICVRAAALWRSIGELRFRDVLRVRLSGEAIEMLTFTGPFLAEPAKGVLLTRHGIGGAHAFGGLATEYLLYTLTSTWMAVVALSLLLARGVLPQGLDTPVKLVVAGMIAFTVGCVVAARTGVGLIVPVVRGIGATRLAMRIEPVERVLVGFMHDRPAQLAEVVGLELLAQGLLAAEIFVTIRALGYAFSSLQAVLVEGAVKFISIAFFFVPGQLGAQESVYTLLFQSLGLPGAIGLTMALVRRVRALIVAGMALAVTYAI
jgi:lysylphosphatidylglycerol synthase-like protein